MWPSSQLQKPLEHRHTHSLPFPENSRSTYVSFENHTNYLSSTIVEELVKKMGEYVSKIIISRIKSSKYYSVSMDGPPDEIHTDQLTLICWYIDGNSPVERFLKFFHNPGHKAEDMFFFKH